MSQKANGRKKTNHAQSKVYEDPYNGLWNHKDVLSGAPALRAVDDLDWKPDEVDNVWAHAISQLSALDTKRWPVYKGITSSLAEHLEDVIKVLKECQGVQGGWIRGLFPDLQAKARKLMEGITKVGGVSNVH